MFIHQFLYHTFHQTNEPINQSLKCSLCDKDKIFHKLCFGFGQESFFMNHVIRYKSLSSLENNAKIIYSNIAQVLMFQ